MNVEQIPRQPYMKMKLHSRRQNPILDLFLIIDCTSLKILPRVMRDVSNVNTSTSFFGRKCAVPFGLAPSAMQKLAGGDGEMDVARAAAKLGVNLTLSSQSTTSLEDVISCKKDSSSSLDPAFWMQLYLTKDPEKSIPLIKRAEGIPHRI
jgi:(S)-2-hydroxy-acid oxidase